MLSKQECLRRLGRGGVGRVAVTIGALPAVFPVNYATLDGDIIFRTTPGTKLAAAIGESVVAFEIDRADRIGQTGWSVMVVGPARTIVDPDELARAAALPLTSWAAADDDVFVRIQGSLVSGRVLTHALGDDEQSRTFPLEACPSCDSDAIAAVHDGETTNFVCTTCWSCWHVAFGVVYRRPAATCPGCGLVELCRAAQPTLATTEGALR